MQVALVFGAHDDDAPRHMGGTILALLESGVHVEYVVLSAGEMGTNGSVEVRAKELAQACAILGCDHHLLGPPTFRDTAIVNDEPSRLAVVEAIRSAQPETIFAPWPEMTTVEKEGPVHVDHAATGALVRDAFTISGLPKLITVSAPHAPRRLFYYMTPWNVPGTICCNVEAQLETAMQAARAFTSQGNGDLQSIEELLRAKRRASGGRRALCELFVPAQRLQFQPRHFLEV